jgi:hypothetical protein
VRLGAQVPTKVYVIFRDGTPRCWTSRPSTIIAKHTNAIAQGAVERGGMWLAFSIFANGKPLAFSANRWSAAIERKTPAPSGNARLMVVPTKPGP